MRTLILALLASLMAGTVDYNLEVASRDAKNAGYKPNPFAGRNQR